MGGPRGDLPASIVRSIWRAASRRISRHLFAVLLVATIQVAVLTYLQYLGYLSFQTSASDIGSYNQAFFTTVRSGLFFYYTVNLPAGTNGQLFAVHFLPLLVVLAPVYSLAPGPMMLIAIKQIALAGAAFPLFGLARWRLKSGFWAMGISIAYLVSPLTATIDWDNFDPEVFLPLAILAAIYFYARGRFVPFLFAWGAALAAIEATAPLLIVFAVASGIGLYLGKRYSVTLTRRREAVFLLAGIVFAVAYFAFSYEFLTRLNPLGGAFGGAYAGHFSILGASSIPSVLPQAITHPALASQALHYQEGQKTTYVLLIFGSLGFVPLLGEKRFLIPIIGWLTLAFLSNDLGFYNLGTEYPAYVTPFLFPAFIGGIATLRRWFRVAPDDRPEPGLVAPKEFDESIRRSKTVLPVALALRRSGRLSSAADGELSSTIEALRTQSWTEFQKHLDQLVREAPTLSVAAASPASGRRTPPLGPRIWTRSAPAVDMRTALRSVDRERPPRWMHLVGVYVLVCLLIAVVLANPLNPHPVGTVTWFDYGVPIVSSHNVWMQKVIALIPATGSVLTTSRLFPEVSNRANAYLLPTHGLFAPNRTYQGVIEDYANRSTYVLIDFQVDALESLYMEYFVNLSSFGVVGAADGSYLYERGWSQLPRLWAPATFAWAGADVATSPGAVQNAPITQYGKGLYHPADKRVGSTIWAGPHILIVPPGTYRATFWWTITVGSPGTQLTAEVTGTPIEFNVTPTNITATGHHYNVTFSASPPDRSVLQRLFVNSSSPAGSTIRVNGTAEFAWQGPGYLDTSGLENNPKMSMFLYAILFTQESP